MFTRRQLIWTAAAIPVCLQGLVAAGVEFWNNKQPDQWSPDDLQEMLTRSPWAKPAVISFNTGPGGAAGFGSGRSVSTTAGMGGSGGRRGRQVASQGGSSRAAASESDPKLFSGIVRWESARPIRQAAKITQEDDVHLYYILGVIGDLPGAARGGANDEAEAREQRQEMLREFTKLERKGDTPIYLDHVEPIAGGMLFFFSRLEPITPANKEITFTTKMGPLEIKAKFPLKDMMYRGMLEL